MSRVLRFYGIEMQGEAIDAIVEACSARRTARQNLTAANVLPDGYSSNFRSGKIGGWRDELSEAHIEKCRESLGDTLVRLGYERDVDSW